MVYGDYAGIVTFNIKYGYLDITIPGTGWHLYASDTSNSIVRHNPSKVPMAWLISNQTGIKASFDKDIIVFRKRGDDRVFNQWAEATLKLPSLTIVGIN